jgi:hypothetical protein
MYNTGSEHVQAYMHIEHVHAYMHVVRASTIDGWMGITSNEATLLRVGAAAI